MDLEKLTTETRNPASMKIDEVSTLEMVQIMNQEDQKVALAVEKVLPEIATAIDQASQKFLDGGRLIYCGAGTSGRLGTLDAIELTPTYSVSAKRAFGLIAGGKEAMFQAVEGAEDSKELAIADLKRINLTSKDVVIAIAASGRTPYAISAIEYGQSLGALTIAVTCNNNGLMNQLADISIAPVVGPEVITGSTRMKAGTAQKMVLNTLSTGIMVKIGNVFENLMINVQPTNEKLVQRATNIVAEITKLSSKEATSLLEEADGHVNVAIVMNKKAINKESAMKELKQANGRIFEVLKDRDVHV